MSRASDIVQAITAARLLTEQIRDGKTIGSINLSIVERALTGETGRSSKKIGFLCPHGEQADDALDFLAGCIEDWQEELY